MSCRDFKELFLPAHSSVILRTVSTRRVQIVSRSGGQPSSRKLFLIHEFLLLRKTNSVSFKHRYVQIECEQMLSCKEPGGLFAICSQGNFPLWGNFRASAGSTARDAAEGNPPRGILFFAKIFLLRKNLSASFKRQVWRKLSEPAQGNPARLSDFGSKANANSLGSFLGVPKKRRSIFWGEVEG